ncbi:MAG: DNA/RNA non-specific endonuclease [Bacteroidales bacterium]|nr:DNA/RNA non-specific endonuclease [Bacteroidales bacterium]
MSSTGATLSGSFEGATGNISRTGFKYGTVSGSLSQDIYTAGNATPFSETLTGLAAETTYYYQAYVYEYNESTSSYEYRYGSELSFTTPAAVVANKPGVLSCYEIPDVTGEVETSGDEVLGTTQWTRYSTGNSKQKVVMHTFNDTILSPARVMRSYTLMQDYDKKCALWVACVMHGDDYPSIVGRKDNWAYDPALSHDWQPDLSSSYPDKGGKSYDRGHQIASSYLRTTSKQAQMSCYYTNMTPQLAALNQGKWQSTIETNVRNLGNNTTGRDTLYVVSGPLFVGNYDTVEDKNGMSCAKPTHYYQCFMKVSFNNSGVPVSAKGAAYLVEHVADPEVQYVTIDYVESLSGLNFFANVPAAIQNAAESTATPYNSF